MPKKYEGTSCEKCAGCYLMRDPDFLGKARCLEVIRVQPKVWCADEAIAKFRKTGCIV